MNREPTTRPMTVGAGLVLWLVFVPASCAKAQSPPVATPAVAATPDAAVAELPPLPRSSIAAVIQRRDDLDLSDDQVRQLELLDLERDKQDAAIRDEVERKRQQARDAKAAPPSGGAPPAAPSGGGMRGGGMRGGGMRGGGMGRGPRPAGPGTTVALPSDASIQDRMDANDTKAYLDGEALLNDDQRDRAREIASEFREKLYERRELSRTRASQAK